MLRKVVYHDETFDVDLTVRSATVRDAVNRALWQAAGAKQTDPALRYLGLFAYPTLVAASGEKSDRFAVQGEVIAWPPSFEDFCNLPQLPDALFDPWLAAVYDCNPAWQMALDAAEKKESVTTPTGASSTTSRRRKSGAKESNTPT